MLLEIVLISFHPSCFGRVESGLPREVEHVPVDVPQHHEVLVLDLHVVEVVVDVHPRARAGDHVVAQRVSAIL